MIALLKFVSSRFPCVTIQFVCVNVQFYCQYFKSNIIIIKFSNCPFTCLFFWQVVVLVHEKDFKYKYTLKPSNCSTIAPTSYISTIQ